MNGTGGLAVNTTDVRPDGVPSVAELARKLDLAEQETAELRLALRLRQSLERAERAREQRSAGPEQRGGR